MTRSLLSILVCTIIQSSIHAGESISIKSTPRILFQKKYLCHALIENSSPPAFDPKLQKTILFDDRSVIITELDQTKTVMNIYEAQINIVGNQILFTFRDQQSLSMLGLYHLSPEIAQISTITTDSRGNTSYSVMMAISQETISLSTQLRQKENLIAGLRKVFHEFDKNNLILEQSALMGVTPDYKQADRELAKKIKPSIALTSEAGTVTINVRDADIIEILKAYSLQTGQSIVVSPDVVAVNASVRLNNVPWRDALDEILTPYGYSYRMEGDTVLVGKRQSGSSAQTEKPLASPAEEQASPKIQIGDSVDHVLQTLGTPRVDCPMPNGKHVLFYKAGEVHFQDGIVTSISMITSK